MKIPEVAERCGEVLDALARIIVGKEEVLHR